MRLKVLSRVETDAEKWLKARDRMSEFSLKSPISRWIRSWTIWSRVAYGEHWIHQNPIPGPSNASLRFKVLSKRNICFGRVTNDICCSSLRNMCHWCHYHYGPFVSFEPLRKFTVISSVMKYTCSPILYLKIFNPYFHLWKQKIEGRILKKYCRL